MNAPANLPNLPILVSAIRRDWSRVMPLPNVLEVDACNREARGRAPYVSGWMRGGDGQSFDSVLADFKADYIPEGTSCCPVSFDLDYSSLTGKFGKYASIRKHVGTVGFAGFQIQADGRTNAILSIMDAVCTDQAGTLTRLRAKRLFPSWTGPWGSDADSDGVHCRLDYGWKPERWYRLLLRCGTAGNQGNTTLDMWVCDLSTGSWTFLCQFDLGAPGIRFRGDPALFLEGILPQRAGDTRAMECRNYYIHGTGGWRQLTAGDFAQNFGYPGSYRFGADGDTFYIITTGVKNRVNVPQPQTRLSLSPSAQGASYTPPAGRSSGTGASGSPNGHNGGATASKKGHPFLTFLLIVGAIVLAVRCMGGSSKTSATQSTSRPTATARAKPTATAMWMVTKAPLPAQAPATPEPTARLEWVNNLYSINDIILGHCEILKESSFVFGVAPEARAGMTDQELYDAIYDIADRWCMETDLRFTVSQRTDGMMVIHMSGAYLRDGIRMARGQDLSDEERSCLQQIRQVVANLLRSHPNGALDIETAIYEYICDHMVYRTFEDFPEGDQRRRDCTSSVNAFMKGFGNCQAYSDLFYIMGTEAGLDVNYLSGTAEGEAHLWNFVNIDGHNLMVDVTFGDAYSDGFPQPIHYYMNFGLDRCGDRRWPTSAFVYEFEAKTNDNYTYYRNAGASSGYAAPNLDYALDYCMRRRRQGYMTAEVLIPNQYLSPQTVQAAIERKRIPWRGQYWDNTLDGNTWIIFQWLE